MPPRVGMGEGRPFSGSSASPRGNFTHAPNVLASLMARLGVGGQGLGQASEMSAGPGMAIPGRPHNAGVGTPDASWVGPPRDAGAPMPAFGTTAPAQVAGAPPLPPAPTGPGTGALDYLDPNRAPAPTGPGTGALGSIDPNRTAAPSGPAGGGGYGLVPLGNGMFYDPSSNQVVGSPTGGSSGGMARSL